VIQGNKYCEDFTTTSATFDVTIDPSAPLTEWPAAPPNPPLADVACPPTADIVDENGLVVSTVMAVKTDGGSYDNRWIVSYVYEPKQVRLMAYYDDNGNRKGTFWVSSFTTNWLDASTWNFNSRYDIDLSWTNFQLCSSTGIMSQVYSALSIGHLNEGLAAIGAFTVGYGIYRLYTTACGTQKKLYLEIQEEEY